MIGVAMAKTVAAASGLPVMLYDIPGRTGVTIAEDTYRRIAGISNFERIIRFDNIESKLDSAGTPAVVTDKLPSDRHHGWKFIRFGPDGLLYVPVGSPCNMCDRGDPYATILRMKPDGSNQQQITSFTYKTVGVNIDITPRTHHDDDVSLALKVEISSITVDTALISGVTPRRTRPKTYTGNVDKLTVPGKALYSCMLNPQGGVVDDTGVRGGAPLDGQAEPELRLCAKGAAVPADLYGRVVVMASYTSTMPMICASSGMSSPLSPSGYPLPSSRS